MKMKVEVGQGVIIHNESTLEVISLDTTQKPRLQFANALRKEDLNFWMCVLWFHET